MNKEHAIQILIYSHALFGGVALLSGFVSLIVKKGKKAHKKSGKLFYYSMLLSALSAGGVYIVYWIKKLNKQQTHISPE